MPSLKIELDARQARAEAQQFVTAIDRVTVSTEEATAAIDIYGLNATRVLTAQETAAKRLAESSKRLSEFNRAAGASNEIVSVTQRVNLLGDEIRNLGSGFSSAANVGRLFGTSLIDVAQASSRAEGGLSGVVTLLRSSPLLAAGVVITAISTAMALFGDSTKSTNSELEKQIRLQDELRRASTDLAAQLQKDADLQRIGFPIDQQANQFARARRLSDVASGLAGQQGFQSFADLQALTGLREDQLRLLAPAGGIAQSTRTAGGQNLGGMTFTTDLGLTNEAAREVLLLLAENIKANADLLEPGASGGTGRVDLRQIGPTLGPELPPGGLTPGFNNSNLLPDIRPVDPQAFREAQIEDQRALAEFNRELERTRQLGEDVGTALGNSFFGFLQNANNARQVLVGLLQQLSAIAQAQVVRGFANQIGNVFASTQAQNAPRTPGVDPA